MFGYSVKLPLKYDLQDGAYLMNKNLKEVVAQNFKMLLLTNKGERVMDTNFGIGLRAMLFQNRTLEFEFDIKEQINRQVKIYLPFINITKIEISDVLPEEQNSVFVNVEYSIPSIKEKDNISLILDQN